ncbi:protein Daple-like isoform X2 [Fundulus heteroclitus]|uniref:protein Daple-like isoform X2 n=1 Tax=Fundulus heteroclitus TaxID=8078 RepID=UPI00165A703C|nr:protein Daple-like isoform X2 [Fundulus heteroclitus]
MTFCFAFSQLIVLKEQEGAPSSAVSNMHQKEDSPPDVDEWKTRKNFSFSEEEVQIMERRAGTSKVSSNSPVTNLAHSALNRQREQLRIEQENLAYLKRLESVQPTLGMRCSEQLADHQRLVGYPSSSRRTRKNFSFSDEEVQTMERENQRLLREMSRLSLGPKTAGMSMVSSNFPVTNLAHSALNRQREQLRIERENLAYLKRLESVQPTLGMRCSEQLVDHQRLVGYPSSSRRTRKNFSFSDEEVQTMERENQRLLREMSRLSLGPKTAGTSMVSSKSPVTNLAHSALNRQREQLRIERENLAYLKRLEFVQPTSGLRHSE